jgi:hypothetical protein
MNLLLGIKLHFAAVQSEAFLPQDFYGWTISGEFIPGGKSFL